MLSRLIAFLEAAYRRADAWLGTFYDGHGDIYGDAIQAHDKRQEERRNAR